MDEDEDLDIVMESKPSDSHPVDLQVDLPTFDMPECVDVHLLGMGSFADVSVCEYRGQTYVLKQITYAIDRTQGRDLYVKELRLLHKLKGHRNVVEISAYCFDERAFMLEYVRFSFDFMGLSRCPVSSLDKFLDVLNDRTSFRGSKHLQLHIATDVARGLAFLHSKDVVHRDLKSENVLVCNRHYTDGELVYVTSRRGRIAWNSHPVICKLTDFGESRAPTMRTRATARATCTRNLARGSLCYRAPETFQQSIAGVDLQGLKAMDVWSLAMVIYELLNPDTFAYQTEISNTPPPESDEAIVQRCHKARSLPLFSPKYASDHDTLWLPLKNVYRQTAVYSAQRRPTAETVLQLVIKEHVVVTPLSVSLSHNTRLTQNACTFVCLLSAERLLQLYAERQVTVEDLRSVASDVILRFPPVVNTMRNVDIMYTVTEAYSILRHASLCAQHEFEFPVVSSNDKCVAIADDELKVAIGTAVTYGKPFCAVYTVTPYAVLICGCGDRSINVVDPHAVSNEHGGDCRNGLVVQGCHKATSLAAVTNWLRSRMFLSRTHVAHELCMILPTNTQASHQPVQSTDSVECLAHDGQCVDAVQTHGTCPTSTDNCVGQDESAASAAHADASITACASEAPEGQLHSVHARGEGDSDLDVIHHTALAQPHGGFSVADVQPPPIRRLHTVSVRPVSLVGADLDATSAIHITTPVSDPVPLAQTLTTWSKKSHTVHTGHMLSTEQRCCGLLKRSETARANVRVLPTAFVRPTSSIPWQQNFFDTVESGFASVHPHCGSADASPPPMNIPTSSSVIEPCDVTSCMEEPVIHVLSDSDDSLELEVLPGSPQTELTQHEIVQSSIHESSVTAHTSTDGYVEGRQEASVDLWMSCSSVTEEVSGQQEPHS